MARRPEEEVVKVEVSPLLAVDTPAVMWLVRGFEEPHLGSVGGGSSGGEPGGGGPPTPNVTYMAICDAFVHPADLPGTLSGGVWTGAAHEDAQKAFNDANAHDDGGVSHARVFMSVGATFVGPLSQI